MLGWPRPAALNEIGMPMSDWQKRLTTEMKSYPTLALMRSLGIYETRENYLELAYLQKNPELSAEEEAEHPEQFQLPEEPIVVFRHVIKL